MTIIVNGFLNQLLVTGGYAGAAPITVTDYADPRQGTNLSPDVAPITTDPRQGSILAGVEPRFGSVISIDTDPDSVDPRQGIKIH